MQYTQLRIQKKWVKSLQIKKKVVSLHLKQLTIKNYADQFLHHSSL
jgi:hypothetical protein